MRCFVLYCLVVLATCQSLRYDLNLNQSQTYEYEYEGEVNFGLAIPNVAQSGVRITCKVQITNEPGSSFFLQVSDLAFAEFNGFPGRDSFNPSINLTNRIKALFAKPFTFDYANGHVSNIAGPAGVSDTIVNIVRGILSFIHVTVKTTKTNYDLEEMTIYGKCPSYYSTVTHEDTKDMTITQVVDIASCKEKAEIYSGMAAAAFDNVVKQRGESVVSTVRYVYTVKPAEDGGIITSAQAVEEQVFSPFNVKGGTFNMKAMKKIRLLNVTEKTKSPHVTSEPMENKGDIKFKFTKTDVNIPLVMQNLQDPKSKAGTKSEGYISRKPDCLPALMIHLNWHDGLDSRPFKNVSAPNNLTSPIRKALEELKRLAKANIEKVDSATTEYSIKLYQLLRILTDEELEGLWTEVKNDDEHRRWFLDMIVEIGDRRILKFLETRFEGGDLQPYEALQTFLMALSHLQASTELVEESKRFLEMPFIKSERFLRQTVVLSYGSLVYKYCVDRVPCPGDAVKPLNTMAKESLDKGNEADMILALKALGNAGHPGSIKTIRCFLPGVSANPVNVSPRVLSAAVQSMRLIATRDPHEVQDITMRVFLQKDLPHEIRMLAFVILFETRPPIGLVSAITAHLMEEKDLHVASFAYSYLRSIARSRTPENHFLSISCNVAIKILTPKFGHVSYYYSKAMRLDWFHDDFLIGTATEFYMLYGDNFPTEIMMKGKLFAIGRILQLLEMGIYTEGLKELLADNGFQSYLQNWVNLPDDKVIISPYSRAFGQEWFYADFTKAYIEKFIKDFSLSAGKDSPLWTKIEDLQRGILWHSTKPLLTFEARYIQATSLGLPVEISKYYHTINGITVNATADFDPGLDERLDQLLTSKISLKTNGFVGFTKDFWVFYGINTELFQYAVEFQAKVPVSMPWSFDAMIDIKENKFKVDFPACAKDVDFFSVSSNVYAVSRNAEEPELAKRTPMIPTVVKTKDDIDRMMSQHLTSPYCLKSPIYGARLCVEWEFRRQYYHEEYPLYYFLGYTRMAFRLVPVQADMAIDKIHFEVNGVSNTHPEATKRVPSDLNGQQDTEMQLMNCTGGCEYNIKAFAMSNQKEFRGYEANFRYSQESDVANAQVNVTEVGEDTKWQMFIDASAQGATAKTHIKWGEESESYDMSMSAEVQEVTKPTFNTTLHWTNIPESLAEKGKSIERYIPGMALLLGFYEKDERSDSQEISASVIAATEDSVDLKIKLPEYSVCYRALPLPLRQNFTNATVNILGPR